MFTQCPKCQSVFMVSDKDIRAHEGLVRCGNCYSVFNSSWNLTDDPRSEIAENPVSDSEGRAAGQGTGFTFSLLGTDTDALTAEEVAAEQPENLSESGNKDKKIVDERIDHNDDDFLEPFPEPEEEEELHPVPSAAEDSQNHDSLLYFDSGDVEGDEAVAEADSKTEAIEDSSIMKMPSFFEDGELLDLDDPVLEADVSESESTLMSMTDESMWPGSEVSFADIGGDFDLPVLDDEISDTESTNSEAEEILSDLPEIIINKPDLEKDLVEGLSDPFHFNQTEDVDEDTLPDSVEETAIVEDLTGEESISDGMGTDEPFLPPLEDEDEIAEFEQDDSSVNNVITDDTLITGGHAKEVSESISAELLAEAPTDDGLDQGTDEDDETAADSVFITSEDEELDEAYVPITVTHDERDELFHDLDDFPEPGELTKLNYDDTMEINAMLEAANISKEQIDSALISSEEGDDDNIVEEIMLSSDSGVDLSEAIFIPNDEDDTQSGDDSESRKKTKAAGSFLKNLMPLGWGEKKSLTEPSLLDPDETQLIQNLNRGKNKTEFPEWVKNYSLIAAIGLLILALMLQIGYFYMDKLVSITPIRPLLEVGCKVAGCTVPTIQNTRDIEQLSSRLTPLADGDGGFKVDSILVNRGIRSQDLPALELTLTDRAGNMISRRVVTPDKYLPAGQSTEMKPNAAADVSIRFRTPSIRVDGFELRPVSQSWLER